MAVVYREVKALLRVGYNRQISILPNETITYERITLTAQGLLSIAHGYCWDHASGAFDTKSIIEGALVHDALCELMHNKLLPDYYWDQAARVMKAINLENGMWKIRAAWIARAIKIAGPKVTESRKYKEI